jgi:hypothetical protein
MTKNHFVNALSAILYIAVVASVMYYGPKWTSPEETVVGPVAFLSLFVLSAAVTGTLFFLQPIQLYLDGEKKQAVNLSLSTLAVFGVITALILLALFSGFLS